MTFLIKLTLGYEQLAREKINDNYAWHKKAWTLFEYHPALKGRNSKPEGQRGPAPFLSRYVQRTDHTELLVLSKYEPVKPSWCSDEQWRLITIDDSYLSQSSYLFDLYANPTRSIKKTDGNGGFTKNGRRLTLMDETSQVDWLKRKGSDHGFILSDDVPLRIDKPVNHRFKRKDADGLHIGVRFQGALHVTDRTAFQKAFHKGIGTAKGFGFGMLMIKPAQLS